MSTKIIEVTGTQPLVTVDDNVSNVTVVNQPIEVTVQSAVAVGNTTIRNALGYVDPIYYDKVNGVFGFIDRSEVVRSEKMVDAAATPEYAGELTGVVTLDAEQYDIFPIIIAGPISEFDFLNITSGQTVTLICTQSTTPAQIDESSGAWSNWFWTNNNNHFPENENDTFIIRVLWTGNTYYASLIEFDTVMPTTQVGIPVGPDAPDNPEPGWLWYDTNNSLLMIYVDGAWVIAGGGGGANVHVGDQEPLDPVEGDLWFDTGSDPNELKVYHNNVWQLSIQPPEGPRGFTGSQGGLGYTGSRGSQGEIGYTGSRGFDGSAGYTGSASTTPGPTGFTGSQGFTGSIGFTGSTGADSTVAGPQGYAGSVGFTGSAGFTGSQGLNGLTGSAGATGATGFTGSLGFTGSQGINGLTGSQGAVGFTGSKGEDGQGVIQAEPPQDDQQYARTYKIGAPDGEWELITATGGGDWDGVLEDKSAVIDHNNTAGINLNQNTSGIVIGKNGFINTTDNLIPIQTGQENNIVIGRNSYINNNGKNIIVLGSENQVGSGLSMPDNSVLIGNIDTKTFYMGTAILMEDDSVDKYGSTFLTAKLTPVFNDRDLVITAPGSIILANNTGDPDQGLQINTTRLRYRNSLLPDSTDADNRKMRREIYFDATNILSSATNVQNTTNEANELTQPTFTWRSRRQLNYISPERIRFRKFAECVNYEKPGVPLTGWPDTSTSDSDLLIELHRGTIQHKILTQDVTNIAISDIEWTEGSTLRNMGHVDHDIEPGTSITIILYHKDALRTITWPSNFKFLGGENTLSTEASALPDQNINGAIISNIQAIDMLHAFYDGYTWWCSITRGYE